MMAVAVLERHMETQKVTEQKPNMSHLGCTPMMRNMLMAARRCSCASSIATARRKEPMKVNWVSLR